MIERLADPLEHHVERLARLRLGQLARQRLERLRQRLERVGIGRWVDLRDQRIERLARLRIADFWH
ncbi:hypothetical protein [Bradyrhizobium liaoningense]|uniref:hypothetical protein n=1 Tax=Bradyrhizobium liaoningense TaxID=43992 RepID=UPI001BAAD4BB|nr:hypothetical protein [Bradyrhizobium liaoningense]MBR0947126.1 hypothetical protein [Bradyrhizobium liaoningense]MBR1034564.1 hypothetical protein [Bradyrhizobium liaoningense]